jgi:hypothetical protein|tara:strand:- start:7729 stop:8097 length:369 start_codon:yes stop_codon:yes gene_type:complete
MHYHYLEERRTVLNAHGVERGDPTLSTWFQDREAEHLGFNGNGTGGNTHRLWRSIRDLSPLPNGIVEMIKADFDETIATREATKPVPAPRLPTPTEALKATFATTTNDTDRWAAIEAWVDAL